MDRFDPRSLAIRVVADDFTQRCWRVPSGERRADLDGLRSGGPLHETTDAVIGRVLVPERVAIVLRLRNGIAYIYVRPPACSRCLPEQNEEFFEVSFNVEETRRAPPRAADSTKTRDLISYA